MWPACRKEARAARVELRKELCRQCTALRESAAAPHAGRGAPLRGVVFAIGPQHYEDVRPQMFCCFFGARALLWGTRHGCTHTRAHWPCMQVTRSVAMLRSPHIGWKESIEVFCDDDGAQHNCNELLRG